jgi:hypothetical protein
MRQGRSVVAVLLVALAGCSTPQQLLDLGERLGCDAVVETGKIDMKGTGVAGFCNDLPSGHTALLMSIVSSGARDLFLREGAGWDQSDLSDSLVIVGREWAVATDELDDLAFVEERLGGEALGVWRRQAG